MSLSKIQYAQIQFHGLAGYTQECVDAIVRLIHYGDRIEKAALLSFKDAHCFLLTINYGDYVAVKSGFSSGYGGEGPHGLSTALQLLVRHGADIEEYRVNERVINAIDDSSLLMSELEEIETLRPVRPSQWRNYMFLEREEGTQHARLNNVFPRVIPYAIVDSRITDLALRFSDNPDNSIISAFRRLEDIVRKKANLENESTAILNLKLGRQCSEGGHLHQGI